MTIYEIVGWHHRLDGREFEETPGDSEGWGGLACCSPWGHKELATKTEQLRWVVRWQAPEFVPPAPECLTERMERDLAQRPWLVSFVLR